MSYNLAVFIGGTGGRILEAATHLIAANFLTQQDQIDMVTVDMDRECGNTVYAKRTLDRYNYIHEQQIRGQSYTPSFAPTKLVMKNWDFGRANANFFNHGGESCLRRLGAQQKDRIFLDSFFSNAAQNLDISNGFNGDPAIGSFLFDYMIYSEEEFAEDDFNFYDKILNKLYQNQEVRVFLVGSAFGGAGASIFPRIAKSIRKRATETNANTDLLLISGALLLPYFSIPPRDNDVHTDTGNNSLFINSSAALNHFAKDLRFVRSFGNNADWTFDTLYVMGNNPLSNTAELYCPGGYRQENHFHIVDFFAANSMCHFFDMRNGDFIPKPNENNIFVPQLFRGDSNLNLIRWENMPAGSKDKIVAMIRFCSYVATTMVPPFFLCNSKQDEHRIPVSKRLFGATLTGKSKANDQEYLELKMFLQNIFEYCRSFLQFALDISLSGKDWHDPQRGLVQVELLNTHYICNLLEVCKVAENAGVERNNETTSAMVLQECVRLDTCCEMVIGEEIGINNTYIDNELENEFKRFAKHSVDKTVNVKAANYINKIFELCFIM